MGYDLSRNKQLKLVSRQKVEPVINAASVFLLRLGAVFSSSAVKKLMCGVIHASIVLAWCATSSVWAGDGYVYDTAGEVSIITGKNVAHPAVKNEAISSNTAINTGNKSYAVLKFEDGQLATMQANTSIQVKEYHYDPKNAQKSNIIFTNLTGGMRFITGLIGQRNHNAFRLSTTNATIGIRGTEFLVATVNDSLYSQVISGSISMTNKAGVAVFSAGQSIVVTSPDSLPVTIPATALPKGIFSQLEAIPHQGIDSGTVLGTATDVAEADTSVDLMPPASPAKVLAAATVPLSATAPIPDSIAKTASITGSGAHYTGADLKCDFCTGRTNTVGTHTAKAADKTANNPVTGDANMFGKHNLTPSGANTGEICAFCHTPQGSELSVVSTPQWNRSAPSLSSYRAFSSLGSAVAEATGSVSMSCLSCHDGTQAPNIAINTPDNILNTPDFLQIKDDFLLKNHHPVGMPYAGGGQNQNAPEAISDPIAAYNRLTEFNAFTSPEGNKFVFFPRQGVFRKPNDEAALRDVGSFSKAGIYKREDFNKSTYSGSGSSTVWWIETAGSKKGRQKTDLYLFTRTDTIDALPSESTLNQPYVECATCHDPHSTNSTFLRLPGGNARSQVCLTCHNK
jgi:predicted CXXCH cytochrome family protein